MFDWCRFLQAITAGDIDGIGIAVPYELDRSKRMIPSEIHAANARPVAGEVAVFAGNLYLLDREDSAAT